VLNTLLAGPWMRSYERCRLTQRYSRFIFFRRDGNRRFFRSDGELDSIRRQSEQLAVDSITKTLEANVPRVRRLKILIHGQEAKLWRPPGFDGNVSGEYKRAVAR